MATTSKTLSRTSASTTGVTLYTVPSSTTTIVTNIGVSNTSSSSITFTLSLAGIQLFAGTTVAANTTVFIDCKQVLSAGNQITGYASSTFVNWHICGVEIA